VRSTLGQVPLPPTPTTTTTTTAPPTTTTSTTPTTSTTTTTLPGLDVDGDGIDNAIDGQIVSGVFVDQSGAFSNNFTDQHLGGGTSFGSIASRGGLVVRVANAPSPSGFLVTTSAGAGPATVGSCLTGTLLSMPGGSAAVVTCSSLIVQVLEGPIQIRLGGDVVATVPSGATATVTELPGGQFEIENSPTSTAPILVESGGVSIVLEPGESEATGQATLLCHKGKKTMRLNANAMDAHLRHGDTLGACPDDHDDDRDDEHDKGEDKDRSRGRDKD